MGYRPFQRRYYWEAHEAWEPIWHAAKKSAQIACSSRD
ncbi:DUF309 domain-containing protein [Mesorhizobium sp. AR07]|nr:DUF309 domain-containing protein [Mesorhizobium sp. AR07]